MIKAVILAGGKGTRFWPLSRQKRPKQFLPLGDSREESLLMLTAKRLSSLVEPRDVMVVTGADYQTQVKEQLPESQVLSEPVGRNTAASIGLAAIYAQKADPDAILVVLPSDHLIKNESLLLKSLNRAIAAASDSDVLLTLGLAPQSPHTGYGYIKKGTIHDDGIFRVDRFCEKPDLATAEEFFKSSDYLWNSGMFVFRASTFLKAMEEKMPRHMELLRLFEEQIGTALEEKVLNDNFHLFPSISVDYGIMEKAENCCVVPVENLGWSDIGSWEAWGAELPADEHNNRLLTPEPIVIDSSNTIVYSERPVALVGIDDLIIADSGDALLICRKDRAQDVKDVVEELGRRKKVELI